MAMKMRLKMKSRSNRYDTNRPTIIFIIFMFCQSFLSPQVKRWAIITYKHGIYELPHEFPNELRLNLMAFSLMGGLSAHTRKKKDLGS